MGLWSYLHPVWLFLMISVALNIFWFFCMRSLKRRLSESNNNLYELSGLYLSEKAVTRDNLTAACSDLKV